MTEWRWSKMPVSWQLDREMHRTIARAPQGEAIAALKLYIGFCLKANFGEKEGLPKPGCVQISLSQLEQLVDLSRPMVVAGLKLLQEWSIVESLGGRPAIYHIIEYEATRNWTKLTKRPLYGSYSFPKVDRLLGLEHMPNRNRTTLHSLQVYLYLASVRNRDTNKAQVGYKQMCAVLGIPRNWLSAAISMLSTELITVRTAPVNRQEINDKNLTNHYWLRGSLNDPYALSRDEFVPHPTKKTGQESEEETAQESEYNFLLEEDDNGSNVHSDTKWAKMLVDNRNGDDDDSIPF